MVVTQQKRALGIFINRQDAEDSLKAVHDSGFPTENISVVAKDLEQKTQQEHEEIGNVNVSDRIGDTEVDTSDTVVGNTATLSATGFTLIGLSSLAIPGLGVVLAAGSLAVAMVSTVASTGVAAAATNKLVNALTGLNIPENQARFYSDRLQQGNYLIMVEGTEQEIRQAEEIFREHGISEWNVY